MSIASFKPKDKVRVKKTGQLLYVDMVDSLPKFAYCKAIGPNGPKGTAKKYAFADLVLEEGETPPQ